MSRQGLTTPQVVIGGVDQVVGNQRDNAWLLGALEGAPGLTQMADHGWWSIQPRRMMQDMGVIDPENLDEALVHGAYSGLDRALTMTQEEVIAEVSGSKLSGRSGGFFPTGRKWSGIRNQTGYAADPATGLAWAGGWVGEGVAAANLGGRILTDLLRGEQTDLTALPWVNRPDPRRWELL